MSIFTENHSGLVKWLTQFYQESNQPGVKITTLDLWAAMKEYFHLDEIQKSDCFRSLFIALNILKWNTRTIKVRGKKIITGLTLKKPSIYFTSHVDKKKLPTNYNRLFTKESCIDVADFVCGGEESASVVIATQTTTTAFLKEIPIVASKWISDCIAANRYICYDNYALNLGNHKCSDGYKDILKGHAIAFHNYKSQLGITQEWATWAVQRCGGKVVETFDDTHTDVKIVISSIGNSASEIQSKADHIVGELWLLESIGHGLQSTNKFSMLLTDPMHHTVSLMANYHPKEEKKQCNDLLHSKSCNNETDPSICDVTPTKSSHKRVVSLQYPQPKRKCVNDDVTFVDAVHEYDEQVSGCLPTTSKKFPAESKNLSDSNPGSEVDGSDLLYYKGTESNNHTYDIEDKYHENYEPVDGIVDKYDELSNNFDDVKCRAPTLVVGDNCDKVTDNVDHKYDETHGEHYDISDDSIDDVDDKYDGLTGDLGDKYDVDAFTTRNTTEINPEPMVTYNLEFFKSGRWTHKTIQSSFNIHIIRKFCQTALVSVVSLCDFLDKTVTKPIPTASDARQNLYKSSGPTSGNYLQLYRAFAALLFPPVLVENCNISSFCPDSYTGDMLPQFKVVAKGKKYLYECAICEYAGDKKKNLIFVGIKQMHDHALSKSHYLMCQKFRLNNKVLASKPTSQKNILSYFKAKGTPGKSTCCHIFDPAIVSSFKNDQQIHRLTPKKAYEFCEDLKCTSHAKCNNFETWKITHAEKFDLLKSRKLSAAEFVYLNEQIVQDGRIVTITEAIKSKYPSCIGTAETTGKHPYTCKSCYSHVDYLNNLLRKRTTQNKHTNNPSRIHVRGMRNDYLNLNEVETKSSSTKLQNEVLQKDNTRLRQLVRDVNDWKNTLEISMNNNHDLKFIHDCLDLFRQDSKQNKNIQLEVIKNLVGKLKSGRNHHFCDIIKDIAKMHMHLLGETHYGLLQQLLGFPSGATLSTFKAEEKFYPGISTNKFKQASQDYGDKLVVESSDEARVRRTLDVRLSETGDLQLLGKCWECEPDKWPIIHQIPQKDESEGDEDQYSSLEREVHSILEANLLASHVSVHNLNCVNDIDKPPHVISIWPTPNKGYKSKDLYKVQQCIHQMCSKQNPVVKLIGHSTDSAAFSLSLAKTTMTPNKDWLQQGILYLGLGIPEEKYLAPYLWKFPSIQYTDFEHNQRSCLRMLKYKTLDMVLYKDEQQCLNATIDHLYELRKICMSKNICTGLNERDLIQLKFFDQNSEAAYKIFNLSIADLLDSHVQGSMGTSLYIRAVTYLMKPYVSFNAGSPIDVVKSVSTGLNMIWLWKRYLSLSGQRLSATPGAKNCPKKRGNFITRQTCDSLEIQSFATIDHQLALYVHGFDNGMQWASPRRASTVSTEYFIGQSQGKTSHFQTTNQEPSVADFLDRASKVEFNVHVMQELSSKNVKIKPTTNRKKSVFAFQQNLEEVEKYQYPCSLADFRKELKDAFYAGLADAQREMRKLPGDFEMLLTAKENWNKPFQFTDYTSFLANEPPTYNFINVTYPSSKDEGQEDDAVMSEEEENQKETEDEIASAAMHDNEKQGEVVSDDGTNISDDLDSNHANDVYADNENSDKATNKNDIFYINRQGKRIHIKTALKLAIGGRDYVGKERSKRHITGKFIPHINTIPTNHDLVPFRDVAVRVGKIYAKIVHLTAIESEDGNRLQSTSLKSKNRFRGRVYDISGNFEKLTAPAVTKLTSWQSLSSIVTQIDIEVHDDGVYISQKSKDRLAALKLKPFCVEEECESVEDESSDEILLEGEYQVEDIIERRYNKKTHEEEYLTKFKGYPHDDNEWLPACNFRNQIPFTTKSSKGRLRRHKTVGENDHNQEPNEEEILESQGQTGTGKTKQKQKRKGIQTHIEGEEQNHHSADEIPILVKKIKKKGFRDLNRQLPPLVSPIEQRKCRKVVADDRGREALARKEKKHDGRFKRIQSISDSESESDINDIVCPWQGQLEGRRLHNTCTIDGVLSCLFLDYNSGGPLANYISLHKEDHICHVLSDIFTLIHDGKSDDTWAAARLAWNERVLGRSTNISTLDFYGNEETLIVQHLCESSIGKLNAAKIVHCTTHGKMSSAAKNINLCELLDRWKPQESESVLPVDKLINYAITDEGCSGHCRKACKLPAKVRYIVHTWPPLLMLRVYEFLSVRENEIHNCLHKIPKTVQIDGNMYQLSMATMYERGHFSAYLFLKKKFWLYDPFHLNPKRIVEVHETTSVGTSVINYIFYKKV